MDSFFFFFLLYLCLKQIICLFLGWFMNVTLKVSIHPLFGFVRYSYSSRVTHCRLAQPLQSAMLYTATLCDPHNSLPVDVTIRENHWFLYMWWWNEQNNAMQIKTVIDVLLANTSPSSATQASSKTQKHFCLHYFPLRKINFKTRGVRLLAVFPTPLFHLFSNFKLF